MWSNIFATSNPASPHMLAVLCQIVCLLPFVIWVPCECRDTLLLYSRVTVTFLLSLLWPSVMKASFLHVRECSMSKLLPYAHALGVRDNGHPYLMSMAAVYYACILHLQSVERLGMLKHVAKCWCRSTYIANQSVLIFCWLVFVGYTLVFLVSFWIMYVLHCRTIIDTCSSTSALSVCFCTF